MVGNLTRIDKLKFRPYNACHWEYVMTKQKAKPVKSLKTLKKDFRTSEYVWNKAKIFAKEYAGGNMSLWINHAILEAPRKYLVKK